MTPELYFLGWTLVLAVVQIFLVVSCRTKEVGLPYAMSARDKAAPVMGKVTGRLYRAQQNLFETLPLFAAAVLIAHVTGHEGNLTTLGAALYFFARLVYVPVYAMGVPVVRTLVWAVSLVGLLMVFYAIL